MVQPPDREDDSGESGDELRRLGDKVESLERELDLAREMLRQATTRNASLSTELTLERRKLGGLRRLRLVRIALALSRRLRAARDRARSTARMPVRKIRGVRRDVQRTIAQRGMRATTAEERVLLEALRREVPPASVREGPLVSVVIVNRNGYAHLERCLRALATTAYRDIEIIVVDNGSTDGSAELAERFPLRFPVRVIRNADNRSFSEANGQGVAVARGELICFLNNDVDPTTDQWLGYMVETIRPERVGAVGARLIYPRHRGTKRAASHVPDLKLQHAGVAFKRSTGIPTPLVIGVGEEPLGKAASAVEPRVALTAACLLVKRKAFEEIGGFHLGYDYGLEDVDLCLRLQVAGWELMYDGRSALWHHESSTRAADDESYRARVTGNREQFVDLWGPRIFREAFLDALGGAHRISPQPFHVAITLTSHDVAAGFGDWFTAHELGDALESLGWKVSYLAREGDEWYRPDPSIEAVIVLMDGCKIRRLPRSIVTVAWIRNWPDRWLEHEWFDEYDIVLASSERIAERVRARSSKVAEVMPLATNPGRFAARAPDRDRTCDVLFVGNWWGQARTIVEGLPALAALGLRVHVYGKGWEKLPEFEDLHRGYLGYDDVPAAYASARVVVDDAAMPTNGYGSVNSRVFDALATGAVVVSNGRLGVEELFDQEFPTYTDAESLVALIQEILADPKPALERAARYRHTVLEQHTYEHRAEGMRAALAAWASTVRYGIRIGVPNVDVQEQWGDYHFARSLQRSLERSGHPTRIHLLPAWTDHVAAREDVTIHVFGLVEAPTRPGQVNLLWQISHPDRATPAMYDRYDHAFVASDMFAARMDAVSETSVTPLHQATDPERFRPDPTGPHHELLLVANSRNQRRPIVDDLADTTRDLAVYGGAWTRELIDPRFVKGEYIANREVHRYYSSADIVLNDHWTDMRAEGFLSNRLYDALACSAFVISDDVAGIVEEFDGAVVSYLTPQHLRDLVDRYLEDPEARARHGELGREVVLERHTFDHRAAVLTGIGDALAGARPARIFEGSAVAPTDSKRAPVPGRDSTPAAPAPQTPAGVR